MLEPGTALLSAEVATVLVIMQIVSAVLAAKSGKLGMLLVSGSILTASAVFFAMLPVAVGTASKLFCALLGIAAAACYAFFFQRALARHGAKGE